MVLAAPQTEGRVGQWKEVGERGVHRPHPLVSAVRRHGNRVGGHAEAIRMPFFVSVRIEMQVRNINTKVVYTSQYSRSLRTNAMKSQYMSEYKKMSTDYININNHSAQQPGNTIS